MSSLKHLKIYISQFLLFIFRYLSNSVSTLAKDALQEEVCFVS